MLRQPKKTAILLSVCVLSVVLLSMAYKVVRWNYLASGEVAVDSFTTKLDSFYLDSYFKDSSSFPSEIYWVSDTFIADSFLVPPTKYKPTVRWWWPGNQVDAQTMRKEMKTFSEVGFGGIEIQSSHVGIDPDELEEEQMNFVDAKHQSNLIQAMKIAQSLGLFIDLPYHSDDAAGGAHLGLNDNMKTLAYGEQYVLGGKRIQISLPEPEMPLAYYLAALKEDWDDREGVNYLDFYENESELIELFAARTLEEKRSGSIFELTDYVKLEQDSIFVITDFVNQDQLIWNAPPDTGKS